MKTLADGFEADGESETDDDPAFETLWHPAKATAASNEAARNRRITDQFTPAHSNLGFECWTRGDAELKATDFEYRHQKLVHFVVVCAAWLSYLFDKDDIVWRFAKNSPAAHEWERILFIIATAAIAAGASLSTWAHAGIGLKAETGIDRRSKLERPRLIGDLIYSFGLASLFPVSGFILLILGETLRVFRLMGCAGEWATVAGSGWGGAFRSEAVKWGIFIAMIAFTITLRDRVADYLIAAGFLVGSLLNAPVFNRSQHKGESG